MNVSVICGNWQFFDDIDNDNLFNSLDTNLLVIL